MVVQSRRRLHTDPVALLNGLPNLGKHLENINNSYKSIVAITVSPRNTEEEPA
jgi:hypothetical protein